MAAPSTPADWLLDPGQGAIVPDASWLDPAKLMHTDWPTVASHIDPGTGLMVGGLLGFCVFCRIMAAKLKAKKSKSGKDKEDPFADASLKMGLPWYLELWWRYRPIPKPYRMQIGPYRIDTRRKHMGIVGATGSRKTTAATDLVTGDRPCLIATGEPADPLRWKVFQLMLQGKARFWSPRGSIGWDMLQGDPIETAERLTKGHKSSSGDTGLRRSIVQDIIEAVLRRCDEQNVPRNWPMIIKALDAAAESSTNRNVQSGCQDWSQRFKHMVKSLGPALGNGLDIAEELAAGRTVFMEMSSMRSPESTPLVAANILLDGKRAATMVRGGRLIVDEGWAFADRQEELDQLVRAGRRLGWEIYFLTQLPQDYSDDLLANFRNWLFLMQTGTNVAARDWCSKAVEKLIPSKAFSEGALNEGDGWLLTSGRLVKVHIDWLRKAKNVPDLPTDPGGQPIPDPGRPKPPSSGAAPSSSPGSPSNSSSPSSQGKVPGTGTGSTGPGGFFVVEEVGPGRRAGTGAQSAGEGGERGQPALPGPYRINGAVALPGASVMPVSVKGHKDRERVWSKFKGTWNPQGCHLWTEKSLNRGYGKARYLNMDGQNTHFLAWWWRLEEDEYDLRRWLAEHPDVEGPVLPVLVPGDTEEARTIELQRYVAMKDWMLSLDLTIDHCCPPVPNKLCNNWRHLQLKTRGDNSRLMHARRNGTHRDVAEDVLAGYAAD